MPNGIPHFLDIEYFQNDDLFFPTAIAWSLADGRMKTVVIEPDESWLPQDAELAEDELRYLREQGVPLIELARALHDEILIDLIFDAVAMPVPFELAPLDDLIPGLDRDSLEDHRRDLMFEQGLEPQLPENGVYALLLLARQEGLIEAPDADHHNDEW